MFTVHSHTCSVSSSVGHGLVDPKARGVESFENRSGEELHFRQLLVELFGASFLVDAFLVFSRLVRCLPSLC